MQNLSPEKYIRTKARQLPIDKCYINEGWNESGLCTLVISRKHTNNNLTFGVYLVDIFCLGLKDSLHYFNMSKGEFDDFLDTLSEQEDILEIEYPLAHNIIYGAIEFADDFEFKPHKSFQLTQYILEEDTDEIEIIEIPFGIDDKPAVIATEDDPQTRVVEHLKKLVGEGNFVILNEDFEEFEEDEEDESLEFTEELLEDYSDHSVDELIHELQTFDLKASEEPLGLVSELYIRVEGEEKFEELSNKIYPLFEDLEIVSDYEAEGLEFVPQEQSEHLYYLQDLVFNQAENAIEECEKTIKDTPHPLYYALLITAYQLTEMYDEENETIKKAFDLYPDNLSLRINYGFYLFRSNRLDAIEMFMSRFNPSKIAPQRKVFHLNEVVGIVHLACLFYAPTNLIMATVYQQLYDTFTGLPDFEYEKKLLLFQYLFKLQMEDILDTRGSTGGSI
jgi:tetratricopeptide (TPR) repeat protein